MQMHITLSSMSWQGKTDAFDIKDGLDTVHTLHLYMVDCQYLFPVLLILVQFAYS